MIKPVSVRLQKRVTEMGGLSPSGQPLFRVMRGCDRFTWIGGRWKKSDSSGNPTGERIGVERVLKYPDAEQRYIFELLCPPENYGTEAEWELNFTQWIDGQRVETLGPFPRAGEYELVRVIETPVKRAFVPLTEAICDACVEVAKLNKELPERIKREAAQANREREEKAQRDKRADMIDNITIDQRPHVYCADDKEIRRYAS
jgi:hypothetical protein